MILEYILTTDQLRIFPIMVAHSPSIEHASSPALLLLWKSTTGIRCAPFSDCLPCNIDNEFRGSTFWAVLNGCASICGGLANTAYWVTIASLLDENRGALFRWSNPCALSVWRNIRIHATFRGIAQTYLFIHGRHTLLRVLKGERILYGIISFQNHSEYVSIPQYDGIQLTNATTACPSHPEHVEYHFTCII
jgi:hypothetical protein